MTVTIQEMTPDDAGAAAGAAFWQSVGLEERTDLKLFSKWPRPACGEGMESMA